MLYLKSLINCIDNSGALLVECIKVLRKSPKNYAGVGDKIVCVVKRARPIPNGASATQKARKGEIKRAVIVRTKKEIRRPDGSYIQFDDNACVLINDANEPVGNRLNGVVAKEVRDRGFTKVAALAPRVL
ncbi:50S ribosomal protein [Yarrowia sp. C11]|nr:50S ribosomal protein [Yarrowia sp. C11]KAG5364386.1 50S ribosomal protein [Yarrowia sp. E02]